MKLKNFLFALLILNSCAFYAQEIPSKFRLAINRGLGYRIGKIPDNTPSENKTYIRKLKSGYSFDVEANYMIDPAWGLGIQYSNYTSKGNTILNLTDDLASFIRIPVADDISINYVGPQYITKNTTEDGRHNLIASLSFGYLNYKNDAKFGDIPLTLTANTIGYAIGIGYEYRIAHNIGIGAKFGVVGGSVSKFKMTIEGRTETISSQDQQGIERESLTRIDVMGGLRFYL